MKTLIILGKGESRKHLNDYRAKYPSAILWTLNNFFPDKDDPLMHGFDLAKETDLHFDVHHDQRFWGLMDQVQKPWIVSPFRGADIPPARKNIKAFPLSDVFSVFGYAYFESSLCYMIAYAAFLHRHARQSIQVLALPGVDFVDPTHFAYRFGIHFWLGLVRGMGIRLDIPQESACLKRFAGTRAVDTETEFPHIYGQPWSVTEPHKQTYNWS
jgi:hypothetical protein